METISAAGAACTVDSGWLHLLQVSNTDMHNIRWEDNTLVQNKGALNQGILMIGAAVDFRSRRSAPGASPPRSLSR